MISKPFPNTIERGSSAWSPYPLTMIVGPDVAGVRLPSASLSRRFVLSAGCCPTALLRLSRRPFFQAMGGALYAAGDVPVLCSGVFLHVDRRRAPSGFHPFLYALAAFFRWSGGIAVCLCLYAFFAALSGSFGCNSRSIGLHRDRGDCVETGIIPRNSPQVSSPTRAPWAS